MRKLRFSFHTQLQFDQPVTQHFYTLRCIPSSDGVQQLFSVNCRVAPKGNIRYNKDGFCNTIGTGCIKETHQYFSFDVEGVAFVKNEKRSVQDLDGRDAIYRYPTLLTMTDNNIKEFLTQLQIKKEDGAGGLIRLREALAKLPIYKLPHHRHFVRARVFVRIMLIFIWQWQDFWAIQPDICQE